MEAPPLRHSLFCTALFGAIDNFYFSTTNQGKRQEKNKNQKVRGSQVWIKMINDTVIDTGDSRFPFLPISSSCAPSFHILPLWESHKLACLTRRSNFDKFGRKTGRAFPKNRKGLFKCSCLCLKIFPEIFYPRFLLFFSLTWLGLWLGFSGTRRQQIVLLLFAFF